MALTWRAGALAALGAVFVGVVLPSWAGIAVVAAVVAVGVAVDVALAGPVRTLEFERSGETTVRMEAIVWLANYGAMTDAPLLHERLRDESAMVRDYAEQGLWALGSRSGEAAIDRRMARGVDEMQAGRHKAAIATFAARGSSSANAMAPTTVAGASRASGPSARDPPARATARASGIGRATPC